MVDDKKYVICSCCKQRFQIGDVFVWQAKHIVTDYCLHTNADGEMMAPTVDWIQGHILDCFHYDCLQ